MKRIHPSLLLATSLLVGCASSDTRLVRDRTGDLYGAGQPWYEDDGTSPPLAENADLAAYLEYGMKHNAGLRAAFHRWRAAVERGAQVTTLPDPVFTYAHFVEDIQTRTGPQRQRFSLQQRFPLFGQLGLKGDIAAAEAEAHWWKVQSKLLMVEREIKQAYYEYGYLARAIHIDEENLRLLQQIEPVAQRRVQAGANQADLLQLQLEIGRLENDLESGRKFRPALSARLRAVINASGMEPLPLPELREPEVAQIDLEKLMSHMGRDNPELVALREKIRSEQLRVELAGLSGWPDLTIGADYFETGDALNPNTPGSGDDPIAVRVSMELPIWRGKHAAVSREAESRQAAARSELQDRQAGLRAALQHTAYKLDDAARQVVLYRDTLLPRARQAFELTETSYRTGRAMILAVIDSERTLLAFEKAYWRAVSNYELQMADMEAMCGGQVR